MVLASASQGLISHSGTISCTMTNPNDPCPCGSKKKYKRCHGRQVGVGCTAPAMGISRPALARSPVRERAREFLRREDASPGCHQSPEFRALETEDPRLVEVYAEHVLSRRTDERACKVVQAAAEAVVQELQEDEGLGRCKDLSLAFVCLLEAARVWCFAVQGSVRFQFPRVSCLSDRFLWVRDEPDFPGAFMGHMWVVAPPIAIVDITAKHQRWQNGETAFIPSPLVAEKVNKVEPVRRLISVLGLGPSEPFHPELLSLWESFPPSEASFGDLRVTYQPDGIALPEERLQDPTATRIGGRSVADFHREVLTPLLLRRGLL